MSTKNKSQVQKDIEAVEEVLGWDCRGADEEYDAVEKANHAFDRLKKLLAQSGIK